MIESGDDVSPGAVPDPVVRVRRRHLHAVWLVPIVAALIAGWIGVKAIIEAGTTITISFPTAEGLEAGKTKIKYKDVEIGEVTSIEFTKDRKHVIATAQISRQAEEFLVDDTRFWIVRARIASGRVSGLATLVSGTYIGVDVGHAKLERRNFDGVDVPPIVTNDLPGKQFVLRGEDLGSLDIGAPVYYRRVQVGEVVAYQFNPDGSGVTIQIFVRSPYDRFVTTDSRFWHASGVDITVDSTGIKMDTQSLTSIAVGGLAFQKPPDSTDDTPAKTGQAFVLAADRVAALKDRDVDARTYVLNFKESVRGLSVGAQVDFRGVVLGEVTAIDVDFDPVKKEFRIPVRINIYPQRLRSKHQERGHDLPSDPQHLLRSMVERGFRAQLRPGNLLTGQLYVALDFFPRASRVTVDWTQDPPELPTTLAAFGDLQATIVEIAKKIEKIPFDEIGTNLGAVLSSLNTTLDHSDQLVQRLNSEVAPAALATIADTRKALADVQSALSTDAPLQQDLRNSLQELARAARSLRLLSDYLERHPEALLRGKGDTEP